MSNSKKTCSKCSEPSLKGLRVSLCQFHYNEYQWGTVWAEKCRDAKNIAKASTPAVKGESEE